MKKTERMAAIKARAKQILPVAVYAAAMVLPAAAAHATGMPWDNTLTTVKDDLTGPTVQALAVIAVVLSGLGLAFGEGGGAVKKLLVVVCGLGVALGGASIVASFTTSASGG